MYTGADVQVDNRPLTQHGVVGVRKQTAMGGRQVLDKNYFVNELRQKRLDIANVTQKMRVRCNVYACALKSMSLCSPLPVVIVP